MIDISELKSIYHSNKLTHSWIISAQDISSALEAVRDLARTILGTQFPIENNPNFCIVDKQKNSSGEPMKYIAIDQIRGLHDMLSIKNSDTEYKIIVIYQADAMNINAANCCLKLLEEPNKNNFIFLITSQQHKLLPTIRSRCQMAYFRCDAIQNPESQDALKLVEDYHYIIEKLSAKIDKDFVRNLATHAKDIILVKAKHQADINQTRKMLYHLGAVDRILSDLETFDLDVRASLILLKEEMMCLHDML